MITFLPTFILIADELPAMALPLPLRLSESHWHDHIEAAVIIRCFNQCAAVGVSQRQFDLFFFQRIQHIHQIAYIKANLQGFALILHWQRVFGLFLVRVIGEYLQLVRRQVQPYPRMFSCDRIPARCRVFFNVARSASTTLSPPLGITRL